MDWKVENALSRDVERQQLNKILKDVRAAIDAANKTIASNANADIKAIVGQMFTDNTEIGVSAVYNAVKKVIDLSVPNFFIRLQGDVEGTGQVNALGDVTIATSLADGVGGIEEAPSDGSPYWRNTEEWEEVPVNVQQLATLTDVGLVVSTSANTLEARVLQAGDGIDILIPDGDTGDPEISFNADTGEVAFLPSATYQTVQKFIDVMHSPGTITGGNITDLGGGNIRVLAGTAMLRITDDDVNTLLFADFPQTDFVLPADQDTRFFGVVYNAGAPIVEMRTVFDWDKDTEIPLGSAVRFSSTTIILSAAFKTGDPITNVIQRFDAVGPSQRDNSIGGLILAETGTRNITVSAGKIWARLTDFDVTAKNSSVDTMISGYFNGAELVLTAGLTQWDNLQYNDTGAGTLVTLNNNKYANLWFFMATEGDQYGFIYGTDEYNTLAEASTEGVPFFLTENFFAQSLLLGRLLFQKSAATASVIESAFARVFTTQPVSTHNDLSGLQGGTTNEFYHLTAAEYAALQAGYEPAITAGTEAQFWNGDKTFTNRLSNSGASMDLELEVFGAAARLVVLRAGGVSGAPTAITNGSNLFVFSMQGYDGSAYAESAAIQFTATQPWTESAHGTQILFRTTSNGSTTETTRWQIFHDGTLLPATDNTYAIGSSARRTTDTYSVNFRPGTGVPLWTSGSGSPEGVVTASVGSLYTRTDGGAVTTLYVKESGAGNTGWVAK